MSQTYQTVLLVDHVTDVVDCIFDSCDQSDLPPVKFSTAIDYDYALRLLDEREFSLLIVAVGESLSFKQLADIASKHAPQPVIAVLSEAFEDHVFQALRAGTCDVFIGSQLLAERSEFIQSVCRHLSQAALIETNQHYRQQLEHSLSELQADQQAARQIQQNMLPATKLDAGAVQARFLLMPSIYLSGDFVDVVSLDDNRVMFYLADVSGHGASSALVTVLLKNMTNRLKRNFKRGSSFDVLSPIDTLDRINAELLDTDVGKHLSIFIGLYDQATSTLTYAVGGHHPMPILSDQKGCRFVEGRGMPVGLLPEPIFDQHILSLPDPFTLTLFSDGILEVMPEESMQAKENKLLEAVAATKEADPEQVKDYLLPRIIDDIPDDIAIMTISRL